MKKRLVVIRHAKSDWSDLSLKDFDRPLNTRGKRDAPFMGAKLKEKGILPDLFLSSPAKRAKKTAKKIAKQLNIPKSSIIFDEGIYHAHEYQLLQIIKNIEESYSTLYLVAHNYGVTDLVGLLTGKLFDNVPTCGIVAVEFSGQWIDVTENSGELLFFDYPKRYSHSL